MSAPDLAAAFSAFFEAVHGYAPFPWQTRLAARVVQEGWPSLLNLPTGTGKTTALDIALFALAYAPDQAPRRVFLVVDRRIVVDQGAIHAQKILQRLREGASRDIAARLRALFGGTEQDDPFAVAVLRGGMPREDEWAKRPDQPVLGVSTVDQVGSRLLFRGYGISDRMASVHAGLLGNDTLILLDEVHLAEPFAQTLGAIAERWQKSPLPTRFGFVRMSATPGAHTSDAFGLDAADRQHPVLRRRLEASKRARLKEVKVTGDEDLKRKKLASACVEEARALLQNGARVVGIVVNRVDTAREAWRLLSSDRMSTCDAVLLTGRMRPLDRDRLLGGEEGVLARAGAGRDRSVTEGRPLVLVATQCIEAGADLDLDALVTECASLDALRQRFGRLDRRGELGTSRAVVLMRSDQVKPKSPDPVYDEALPRTWAWLRAQGDEVGFGIEELVPPAGDELLQLLAPRVDAPILLPAHLDSWVQTTPRPSPDPEVALWLHGPERSAPEVQLVWRADLDEEDLEGADVERLTTLLSASRPSSLEALSLPIYAVKAWLRGARDQPEVDDLANTADAEPERSREAPKQKKALRWQGDTVEIVDADKLRAGDTLIVPASRGGLSAGNWDPRARETVTDLGDVAQVRAGRRPTLRAHPEVLATWGFDETTCASAPAAPLPDDVDGRAHLSTWLQTLPPDAPRWTEEWTALRALLLRQAPRSLELPTGRFALSPTHRGSVEVTTEDDDSSFVEQAVTLRGHSRDVEGWAERFATCVGLPQAIARDVKLAGWFHDVGKADPRFQRWLVGGSELKHALIDEPLAKSQGSPKDRAARELARRRAGYPTGYRHELLSVAMIERSDDALSAATDRDLVLHLVASHHGWCRPFAPALDHPEELEVELEHGETKLEATTRHGLARLDSGVSDRFWALVEKYGRWGLAWLEAIVRLADHRASEHPSERENT